MACACGCERYGKVIVELEELIELLEVDVMVKASEFELRIPVRFPLKAKEKDELGASILEQLSEIGAEINITEAYYLDLRAQELPLYLVLTFGIAGLAADLVAIYAVLKKDDKLKDSEVHVEIKEESITLDFKGDLDADDIKQIIREAKRKRATFEK